MVNIDDDYQFLSTNHFYHLLEPLTIFIVYFLWMIITIDFPAAAHPPVFKHRMYALIRKRYLAWYQGNVKVPLMC